MYAKLSKRIGGRPSETDPKIDRTKLDAARQREEGTSSIGTAFSAKGGDAADFMVALMKVTEEELPHQGVGMTEKIRRPRVKNR